MTGIIMGLSDEGVTDCDRQTALSVALRATFPQHPIPH